MKGTPVFLRLVGGADDALACPKEATGKEDRLPLVGPLYLANSERKFAMERSVEFAELSVFAMASALYCAGTDCCSCRSDSIRETLPAATEKQR